MKILCSDYDGTLTHGGVDEKKACGDLRVEKKGEQIRNYHRASHKLLSGAEGSLSHP